jgi:hypothetical protein
LLLLLLLLLLNLLMLRRQLLLTCSDQVHYREGGRARWQAACSSFGRQDGTFEYKVHRIAKVVVDTEIAEMPPLLQQRVKGRLVVDFEGVLLAPAGAACHMHSDLHRRSLCVHRILRL